MNTGLMKCTQSPCPRYLVERWRCIVQRLNVVLLDAVLLLRPCASLGAQVAIGAGWRFECEMRVHKHQY